MKELAKSSRKDCPKCGRANSVRVTNNAGEIKEGCFGADCNYFKRSEIELQVSDLGTKKRKVFDDATVMEARSYPRAFEFLSKYYCLDNNANILYSPKYDRVIFNYKDLYVGRALEGSVSPKWLVMSESESPFVVQRHTHERTRSVVLVEDCVSACNASKIFDSIALLGTSIKDSYLEEIMHYQHIYIALDEDATSKSIKIMQMLEVVKPCTIVLLQRDIKYMGYEELKALFR